MGKPELPAIITPMLNTVIKTRVEKIAAGGAGLARIDGKTAFIERAAAGETILCRISAVHNSYVQAELLEIIEASPDRVQPACAFYGKCGGCNLQHLNYDAQLAAKTAILKEAFIRIGRFDPPQPIVVPSEPWEYRNRMQFHYDESGVYWGLKARKSHEIIPVSDCPIADPVIRALMHKQYTMPGKNRFSVYARNGLILSENTVSRGKIAILGRDICLDATMFFQSNAAMLEKLIIDLKKIAESCNTNLPMADIYCGVGTFAAFIGELFPHVDLVEEHKAALALARENLSQHVSAAFYAQTCEQWIQKNPLYCGFMIADPPRQGFKPDLARKLAQDGPPVLAYISCDPATLARDSKILLEGDYSLNEVRFYDFYPQTSHIESLAIFKK